MKKILSTLLIILLLSCTNKQTEIELIREIPKEAKKRVITSFYKSFTQDGELLCGQETEDGTYYRDTVYYDNFNNVLLIKRNDLYTIKNEYYSAKEGKLKKKITIHWGKIEYVEYIRNQKGLLIEKKVSGDTLILNREINTTYKYDKNDVLIEENKLDEKITYKTSPSTKDKIIKTYQVIDNKNQYEYNNIRGLVEQGTEIYDSKNKTLTRKLIEKYNYGYLDRIEDNYYTYDKSGKLLSEIYSGESSGNYVSIPDGLKGKEIDDYIIEHYYGTNLILKPLDNIKIESIYNSKGDLIAQYTSNLVNGAYKIYSTEKFDYEYNKKGDWVKKIMHDFRNLICIREIEYY